MPLLMIAPSDAALPPEQDVLVPGGAVTALIVRQGQMLAIRDVDGGQPAGLYGISLADPALVLSPHHTRVFSNSFKLRLGMRLVTNRRGTAMVLGISAPHLKHDLLMPITESTLYGETGGADQHRAKIAAAFRQVGIEPLKLADPINLFLDVEVGADGGLAPRGASSKAGDIAAFRVVTDLAVVVSAPAADPRLWSRRQPGAIAVRVRNEVADLDDWTHPWR